MLSNNLDASFQAMAQLVAVPALTTSVASAQSQEDDWALVREAQARLDRYDFAGALAQLDRVDPSSDAAEYVPLVRREIREAMAPHLLIETRHFYDTQPFHWASQRAGANYWPHPTWNLGLHARGLLLADALESNEQQAGGGAGGPSTGASAGTATDLPWGAGSLEAETTWVTASAKLWFGGEAGVHVWEDGAVVPTGAVETEMLWLDPLRFTVRGQHDQVMALADAISRHIETNSASATVVLQDLAGWHAELRHEERLYTDGNAGRASHAWFLAPLVDESFRLAAGYAAAYADTARNTWDPVQQVYTPYFTPLDQFRHGPLLALGLDGKVVDFNLSGSVSAQAIETDPNSDYWGTMVRRDWFHAQVEGSLGLSFANTRLGLAHRYEHQSYYASFDSRLTLDVVFPP